MRLFVSVDLPEDRSPGIAAVQEELRGVPGFALTDPEQAHVTLKFLGEVPGDETGVVEDAVGEAVEDADVAPFEAKIGGIGVFPSRQYIRVVWIGIERGERAMARLHEAIEDRTTGLGFDSHGHAFTPHVTIARMNHAGSAEAVRQVLREREPDVGVMRVDAVHLMESDLGSGSPEYSTVARVPLTE